METATVTKPSRIWRSNIESVNGQAPILTAHREQIIALDDGTEIHNPKGSLTVVFDPENPLHTALGIALKAVIEEAQAIEDVPVIPEPIEPVPEVAE
jgi:hypothetical protein